MLFRSLRAAISATASIAVVAGAMAVLAPSPAKADEGMWTFDNFPIQTVNEKYGTRIDQAWLDRVRNAAVRLQGCSASFVSDEGLILTNWHCVVGCVQDLSSPENDYVKNGWTTANREEERRCPGQTAEVLTEIVDVTSTADQMKIFDTLNTAGTSVTVIDVRAGLLSPTLASLRDIGFLDAARSGQITFAVFHILGPSIASLEEIAETASFMDGAKYFLVKNFINNTSFFEWDQATYNSYFRRIKNATEITIPKLNEMAYEQVEVASVPFLKFVANKGPRDETANYSFVLRGYVRHWLGNVWGEFDRIKLTEIVGSKDKAAATRVTGGEQ